MLESIDVTLVTDTAQVLRICGGDLAAPAPTAREPDAEEGRIAQAFKAVVTGAQYGFQFGQGDRGLPARPLAALHRGPGGATEHDPDRRLLAGISKMLEPMRRGQNRNPVPAY